MRPGGVKADTSWEDGKHDAGIAPATSGSGGAAGAKALRHPPPPATTRPADPQGQPSPEAGGLQTLPAPSQQLKAVPAGLVQLDSSPALLGFPLMGREHM